MFKFFIANLQDGLSSAERTLLPEEFDLPADGEFQHEIRVRLEIEKVGRNIFILAELETAVAAICDRCAEPFREPLAEKYRMLYTSDPEMANEADESIFIIHETADEVDLTEPLRETLMLALPAKRLCRPDCQGLCDHCGANLNEVACACHRARSDPRWEKLLSLLTK
jgi:uncharacterized protein